MGSNPVQAACLPAFRPAMAASSAASPMILTLSVIPAAASAESIPAANGPTSKPT